MRCVAEEFSDCNSHYSNKAGKLVAYGATPPIVLCTRSVSMFGPIFVREAAAAPRRPRLYLSRSVYVLSLFLLLCTGYLILAGTQPLRTASDFSRFGGWMFLLLAPLQMLVLGFQAAVTSASSVAQEKDRRTLILLLLTRITGFELVVGKLLASLLGVTSLLAASLPLFLALSLFGGVSLRQVADVYLVTLVTLIAASSLGTVMGLWREKSFQTIAATLLTIALWLGGWEIVASGAVPWVASDLATAFSPARALIVAAQPFSDAVFIGTNPALIYTMVMLAISAGVASWGIARVRVWNPSREVRGFKPVEAGSTDQPSTWKVRDTRKVWNNPILWREVRTRAYGSKIFIIRAAYVLLYLLTAMVIYGLVQSGAATERLDVSGRALPAATLPVAAILVVSLVIVNALAVNSITNERDALAIDLLMVTDITPKEFVFGKFLGVMYVTKEMILLPLVLALYLGFANVMTVENTAISILSGLVLYVFVATLGIHCGMTYAVGRTATLISLGTVFFLCVGIAVCMVIMVSFRGAFQLQLAPFLIIILGGGAALFAAIGWRNPSNAIFGASITLPLVTYYAITQFLLQQDQLPAFATILVGYGFATLAMLIPALSEFDVANHDARGNGEEGV
jgi:ABC-type transport system involved in multi-copper enzyme maturation permease subunit